MPPPSQTGRIYPTKLKHLHSASFWAYACLSTKGDTLPTRIIQRLCELVVIEELDGPIECLRTTRKTEVGGRKGVSKKVKLVGTRYYITQRQKQRESPKDTHNNKDIITYIKVAYIALERQEKRKGSVRRLIGRANWVVGKCRQIDESTNCRNFQIRDFLARWPGLQLRLINPWLATTEACENRFPNFYLKTEREKSCFEDRFWIIYLQHEKVSFRTEDGKAKGAMAIECRTGTRLVSPRRGPKKKIGSLDE